MAEGFLRVPRDQWINRWYRDQGKSLLDISAALLLTLLLLPLMVLIAAAVRLLLGPQVIFRQARAGLHGKQFTCYKFRTMGHERRNQAGSGFVPERRDLLPSANDPRHTAFGTFLRKYGLDELPQLVNVLKRDMSLVGPRPEIMSVARLYSGRELQRFSVKPGLTGYWQVTCRSNSVDLRSDVNKDIEYVSKLSLMNDIRILLRTPRALLFMPAATECLRE